VSSAGYASPSGCALHNGGVKLLREVAGVTIHCCVCLNQGRNTAAVTVAAGYAVCEAHIELVAQPGFNVMLLRGRRINPV
jgi:hypothetical protein